MSHGLRGLYTVRQLARREKVLLGDKSPGMNKESGRVSGGSRCCGAVL